MESHLDSALQRWYVQEPATQDDEEALDTWSVLQLRGRPYDLRLAYPLDLRLTYPLDLRLAYPLALETEIDSARSASPSVSATEMDSASVTAQRMVQELVLPLARRCLANPAVHRD